MFRRRGRRKGLNFYQRKKKISGNVVKEGMTYLFIVLAAMLVAFVFVFSIGLKTGIIGVSMEPELSNGQEVLVNRFIYKLTAPKKGDVIVFLPSGNQNTHYYVKRVVAKPQDRVVIRDGVLYVNDLPYTERELDKIADPGILSNELTLEKDEYFVIGDNINNSEDSRSGNIGPVKASSIVGKVWFHMAGEGTGVGFMD
ncbi:MAG: signal peptidase I [Lachnospiraceae bacterium]|nr:signal peptidase I [Lachnospiraceae bacterium]